jgi:hypothetical protein
MRKLLPFALLIPAVLLAGFFVASLFGHALSYGTPVSTLLGATAWTLLFLIIYGHMRGWRSVRVFLVVFVVGKFSAVLYHQLALGVPIDTVLLKLAGAAIIAWLMFGFFWPRRSRDDKRSA